jgi:hypothetical protein
MKIKKQLALALISHALSLKSTHVGTKVFINTCRPASDEDISVLRDRIRTGDDCLMSAYQDSRGYWLFSTVRA